MHSIFVILFVLLATLRHHPRLGVRRRVSTANFCKFYLCQLLLYATIPVWASSAEKVHSNFVILFVSVATLRHHPRLGVRRREITANFLILFVSVATLSHRPRLGVRRRESAAYFCNSICVSCYFTPPSPFGRQA